MALTNFLFRIQPLCLFENAGSVTIIPQSWGKSGSGSRDSSGFFLFLTPRTGYSSITHVYAIQITILQLSFSSVDRSSSFLQLTFPHLSLIIFGCFSLHMSLLFYSPFLALRVSCIIYHFVPPIFSQFHQTPSGFSIFPIVFFFNPV